MKAIIDRHDVHEVLQHVQRIIRDRDRSRAIFPAMVTARIDVTDRDVIIMGTDLETSLRMRCPAQAIEPGSVCLSVRKLCEIVERLPNAPITLDVSLEETPRVELRCGQARFRLRGRSAEDFPEIPAAPSDWRSLSAKSFGQAIERVVFATSQEESRYTFVGVLMEWWDDEFRLVATNGHRLAVAGSIDPVPTEEQRRACVIHRKTMHELLRLIAHTETEVVYFAHDEHRVSFRTNEWELIARKVVGQFPPFEQLIPRDWAGGEEMRARFNAASLRDACRRMRALAERFSVRGQQFHRIALMFSESGLTLTAHAEAGEAVEELDVEIEGNPQTIALNANYLLDFLNVVRDGIIEMRARTTQQYPVIWQPLGEPYLYLVMPMRLDDAA